MRTTLHTVCIGIGIALTGAVHAQQPGRSDDELGVSEMRVAVQALSALVGVFGLSASETGSDGSRFSERGIRTCQRTLGDAAILCEDDRTLIEATGRYAQLPAHRRELTVFRWNTTARQYEQIDIGATGTPQVRALTYNAARSSLSYTSVVESHSMKQTLNNASTMTLSVGGHNLQQRLRSLTTDFTEEYRETALRWVWPEILRGEWQSTATHFHEDGTQLVESGRVACEIAGTATVCARTYVSGAASRIGVQVWAPAPDGSLEITSLSPQRRTRQRAITATASPLHVDGSIPWRGATARTRGRWFEEKGELLFRNETEETPSRWRVDYEERLTRVQ